MTRRLSQFTLACAAVILLTACVVVNSGQAQARSAPAETAER